MAGIFEAGGASGNLQAHNAGLDEEKKDGGEILKTEEDEVFKFG